MSTTGPDENPTGLASSTDGKSLVVLQATPGEALVVPGSVPGDAWLLRADFDRQGSDLLLTGEDGSQVLVRDYFRGPNPPDLVTEFGAIINADLAQSLAGLNRRDPLVFSVRRRKWTW